MSSINPNTETIIPVIASFDTKGNIKPTHIRVNGNPYKILSCVDKSEGFSPVRIYRIAVEVYGFKKELDLKYYERERLWTIPSELI